MTPRLATLVSRVVIVAVLVAMGVGVAVASVTHSRAAPNEIVVIPSERQGEVEAAAARLRADKNTPIQDQAIADAANVFNDKLSDVARTGDALEPDLNAVAGVAVFAIVVLWLSTGSLIVGRQPSNLAGWMFVLLGTCFAANFVANILVFAALRADASWIPLVPLWAVVGEYTLSPAALLPLMWLLFPDGRPPSARWRWVAWGFLIVLGIAQLTYVLTPGPLNNFVDAGILYMNPFGFAALGDKAGPVTQVAGFGVLFLTGATIVGVRARFKRATGEERQRLRWLVFVTSIAGVIFLYILVAGITASSLGYGDGGPPLRVFGIDPVNLGFILLLLVIVIGVPGAYLIALYRYRLWDLDVVIRKTVIFAVLVVLFMVLLGAAALLLTSAVLEPLQQAPTLLLLAGVALGILAAPMYRVSRRVADRIVFGGRATPYEVLTEFSGRIGETYATEDVLRRMAQVLFDATGAASARVLLRVGPDLKEAASVGDARDMAEHEVAVIHQGKDLGSLAVTMPPSDPLSPAKEGLIRDMARQAGPVLRNVRLIEELRASRQRLVAAQDDERRKLERNIHDGVQQQLVALAVKLRLADTVLDRDPVKAHEALAALQADAGTALEDLRDLARGIYPPLLADKGLAAALEAQARKAAVPTTVEADGIGRHDENVESAVYFCSLEALNNIAKYANANAVTIRLEQTDGHLTFCVTDDGEGFDTTRMSYGTGLQGMADRLDAIGGELRVTSAPGAGTSVTGTVPV